MIVENGYIKLYRCLLDKAIWKKPAYGYLWVHLLLKASFTEKEFLFNGEKHLLKPGQFITGRNALAKETGIPATTIERILESLENGQQIGQENFHRFRVITIINWGNIKKRTAKRSGSGQVADR